VSGLLILVALVPVPFAIGLSGIKFRRLPMIAGALLCLAYLAFLAGLGVWTAACPHCNYGDNYRYVVMILTALAYGISLFVALSMMTVGALTARAVRMRASSTQPHSSRTGDEEENQASGEG
jgi:membrane protein implicated in regulation of membrane protease activity